MIFYDWLEIGSLQSQKMQFTNMSNALLNMSMNTACRHCHWPHCKTFTCNALYSQARLRIWILYLITRKVLALNLYRNLDSNCCVNEKPVFGLDLCWGGDLTQMIGQYRSSCVPDGSVSETRCGALTSPPVGIRDPLDRDFIQGAGSLRCYKQPL